MQSANHFNIHAYGPGLHSGILDMSRDQSRGMSRGLFFVDTNGGGPGALGVNVRGPRGPCKVS